MKILCVIPCPPATVSMKASQWDGKTIWITVVWLDWDTKWMTLLPGRANFDSKLDLFLLLNLCFPLLLFTERTLFINTGLPQGTLLLCLDVKSKCFCTGPHPPVDIYRKKEISTFPPWDWSFREIFARLMAFSLYFLISSHLCYKRTWYPDPNLMVILRH